MLRQEKPQQSHKVQRRREVISDQGNEGKASEGMVEEGLERASVLSAENGQKDILGRDSDFM